MQKFLMKNFGEKEGCFLVYAIFKQAAIPYAEHMKKEWGITNTLQIAKRMEEISNISGWGKIKIKDFNPETFKSMVEIRDSPFLKNFSTKHACNATRGLIAGTLSGLFNKNIDGVESVCGASTGKNECLMLFQTREEWLKVTSKELKKAFEEQLAEKNFMKFKN